MKRSLRLLSAALVLTSCSSSGNGARLGEVSKGDLIQRVTVAGVVASKRKTWITPPYNSYVNRIFVKIGDNVKTGDPIVSLVQSLGARAEDVYPLRSPFNGKVVQVQKSEGEYLEANKDSNGIVRIDDLSALYVDADVPEIETPKLRVGQDVLIKSSAVPKGQYKGVIRQIGLAAKETPSFGRNQTVLFPVRIEITTADETIRPGMSTLIDIIAARKDGVLLLAQEFVQKNQHGYSVTLEDGKSRKIEVGLQNEESFEIVSGLKEGEKVRQIDFFATDGAGGA